MKLIYEAEVQSVIRHKDGTFSSGVAWAKTEWTSEVVHVNQKLELGQRVLVTIDTDPPQLAVSTKDVTPDDKTTPVQ